MFFLISSSLGETNGVQRLEIINQDQLREKEPYVHPDALGALYSPDAGNVIPYVSLLSLSLSSLSLSLVGVSSLRLLRTHSTVSFLVFLSY